MGPKPVRWLLQRSEIELRYLDFLAYHVVVHGAGLRGPDAESLAELAKGCSAAPRGLQVAIVENLARRGYVSLAVWVARSAVDRGVAAPRVQVLAAQGLLHLQEPEAALGVLWGRGLSPLATRVRVQALTDLGRFAVARSEAEPVDLVGYVNARELAWAWAPDGPGRPVDVVNLPSDTYRRHAVRRRFEALGLPLRLVPAVTSRASAFGDPPLAAEWGDRFTKRTVEAGIEEPGPWLDPVVDGSWGNHRTHLACWQRAVDGGCIILEDDAHVLSPALSHLLDGAVPDLPIEAPAIVFATDVLAQREPQGSGLRPFAAALASLCEREPQRRAVGAYGYAVTGLGAARLVDLLTTAGIREPGLDHWLTAVSLSPEEAADLPDSIIASGVAARHRRLSAVGWDGVPLTAFATALPLVESRPFGTSRMVR